MIRYVLASVVILASGVLHAAGAEWTEIVMSPSGASNGTVAIDPIAKESETTPSAQPSLAVPPAFRWTFCWGRAEDCGKLNLSTETENLLPDSVQVEASQVRVTGNSPMLGWAAPVESGTDGAIDPALRSIDVGYAGVPVVYEIKVEPGQTYRLIAGICEGHHQESGQRINRYVLEGKEVGTLDTMRDGRNVPIYDSFLVTDDGDGVIQFEVGTTQDSPDRNSILNVLWLLPGDAAEPSRESLIAGKVHGALVHHDASITSQKPFHLRMALTRYEGTSTDGTTSPIFTVTTPGTTSVVRNAPNDYTLGSEIHLRATGGTFRLRSMVNGYLEFECTPAPGETPAVEILRAVP